MRHVLPVIALVLIIIACSPVQNAATDVDNTHPITPTMGCAPGDVENGSCVLANESNAVIFGEIEGIQMEKVEIGFLAQPEEEGDYPGVVMIHEWWGLNDNIRNMAMHLASQGYVVLAVDLYGGEVATDSSKAGELVTLARDNQEETTQTLLEAADYLRGMGVTSVGSMGWCFGGGQSLQLALAADDLDATVIYYGHLTDDQETLSNIEWPVLGIFAEEDSSIPPSAVNQFKASLDEIGIENSITIYEGVDHAFANPSGSRFAPEETKDAWDKTLMFLEENLK